MKLIKQLNCYSCTLVSAAMVMDKSIHDLIKIIGHDGSEIINTLPPPLCYKGFHIQEIIDAALYLNCYMVPIEADPIQTPFKEHYCYSIYQGKGRFKNNLDRFYYYLERNKGILIGKGNKSWHCVAWDSKMIYDPN